MPKKSSLTALLTHEYIKHKLCIASINEICVNWYSDNDDYNDTDGSVLGNWSTRYAAAAGCAQQPPLSPPPRSFSCTPSPPSLPLPPSPPPPPPPPPPLATLNYQQADH
jgi:hypothetical protein